MNTPRIILLITMAGIISWCFPGRLHAQYVDLLWGRLAYYPLDVSGEDISGNEKHGLICGTLPAPDRNGTESRALFFTGDGDHIRCGSSFNTIRSAVTISCWMKSDRPDSYSHLVSKYDFGADAGFILGVKNEQVLWAGRNKNGQFIQLTSGTRIVDGR